MGNKSSTKHEPEPASEVASAAADLECDDFKFSSAFESSPLPLDDTSELASVSAHLWLIRHGERMDEVRTAEAIKWRKNVSDDRRFDPPLTENGFAQGTKRGNALL